MAFAVLKEEFESLQDFALESGKLRPPVVDQGLGHGPNHALGHEARTGNLQKGSSRHRMRAR